MHTINSNTLGLAIGSTGVVFYFGCMCLMLIAGQDVTIWFFNSILHGLDVSTISWMNAPASLTISGIILTFGLGWIAGFLIGTIYNWKTYNVKNS